MGISVVIDAARCPAVPRLRSLSPTPADQFTVASVALAVTTGPLGFLLSSLLSASNDGLLSAVPCVDDDTQGVVNALVVGCAEGMAVSPDITAISSACLRGTSR